MLIRLALAGALALALLLLAAWLVPDLALLAFFQR